MANSISIKFPFARTYEGGVFETTKNTDQAIRSDLISLLTTKRGQRVMRPNLYSPIFDYIMEPWDDISEQNLNTDLEEKIEEFLGGLIELRGIRYDLQDDGSTLRIEVVYSIIQLGGVTDGVELFVPLAET